MFPVILTRGEETAAEMRIRVGSMMAALMNCGPSSLIQQVFGQQQNDCAQFVIRFVFFATTVPAARPAAGQLPFTNNTKDPHNLSSLELMGYST
ncbi:hypothetical protein DAPPUDRAFT_233890 [Daphnia pulex]|uniref:Uncharacterized protein n=1 Tax=Daphnia pulex TaxID=6669 RepID=E9FW15_DAPPU|nr:hypothetical protein DAPPUDRAFT_233890 [Daphnia pulex]|eukprot:EFX89002.1 hypothetical protein DAPPUDRAFT_233890 [Daphnia pulex]